MSSDENKLIVRRYYEEIVSMGNLHRLAEFISPAYVEGRIVEHGGAANLLEPLLGIGAI
ncbi:MAG: hypothetical protein ACE5H3_04240 [Planctomycetota bacterium]